MTASDSHQSDPTESVLFSMAMREIRGGQQVTARQLFAQHKALEGSPLHALELVFEEYLGLRQQADFSFDAFAARYPEYRERLLKLISVDAAFSDPGIASGLGLIKWPEAGERHDDFQLLECVGRGAFSAVYQAKQCSVSNRDVIVKFTKAQASEIEIEALSRLAHRHIVPVYTVSEIESLKLNAICMPYRGRVTLHDLLREFRAGRDKADAAESKLPNYQRLLASARQSVLSKSISQDTTIGENGPMKSSRRTFRLSNWMISTSHRQLAFK